MNHVSSIILLTALLIATSPAWALSLNKDGPSPIGPSLGDIDRNCLSKMDCVIASYGLSNRDCNDPKVAAPAMCLGMQKALAGADCEQFSDEVKLSCQGMKDGMESKPCQKEREFCPALAKVLQGGGCADLTNRTIRELCQGIAAAGITNRGELAERARLIQERVEERKKTCTDFDHRDLFGPTRNQYQHGQCWSFAAAGLLEEQICLKNPGDPMCRRSLSTIDLSRELWNFGQNEEGGITELALWTGVLRGVCPEELAPYPTDVDEQEALGLIEENFDYLKHDRIRIVICDGTRALNTPVNRLAEIFTMANEVSKIFKKYVSQEHVTKLPPSYRELLEELHRFSPEWQYALRDALIPQECEGGRITEAFQGLRPRAIKMEGKDTTERVSLVEGVFAKGSSAILRICAKRYLQLSQEDCGDHALIVNGQRWNPKGFCEWNLKNSHGEGSSLDGWLEAEGLVKNTMGIIYLDKKAK